MEIHTFDTVYFVIHSGKTKGQMPVYLCRKESDGQLYQLFAMKKQFIRKETISFLNEQLQNKEFDDFSDLFLYQEQLFAAIRYYADSSLEEKKEENLEFEERLEIGRQILEKFLITKMPAFFFAASVLTQKGFCLRILWRFIFLIRWIKLELLPL